MGQAKRKATMGSPKRKRFIYLMRLISKYPDWSIVKFANNRNL
jgi:hypothetical protein